MPGYSGWVGSDLVSNSLTYLTHGCSPAAEQLVERSRAWLAQHGWHLLPLAEAPNPVALLAFGGDGTLLRAADQVRGRNIPIVGINLGHLGFLTEADADDLPVVLEALIRGQWRIEDRATVVAETIEWSGERRIDWALNEVTLEKATPQRMIEVHLRVDGRSLSTFGCDGVVVATPTGSTGHAFSAGGPVAWPEVEALLVVPVSAHALFARPLVVAPTVEIAVTILPDSRSGGVVSFDSQRGWPLAAGGQLTVRRSAEPVRLVRFADAPFADRLVRKFALPVDGWRAGKTIT
ncbi:MAG: NAD kinase [Bifidobacteriaceae bacterium]|jgi:NAD+ kinase|nr:NAD kinase [Bifidobacteriaceae bacterium]